MTGFFPIMMFALPAAALAIWHEAKPEHKKAVGGIMLSAALTLVPHRRDRAAGVRVHVRGLAALPHPRGAHRHLAGAGQRARASRTASGSRRACSTTSLNFNIATKPLLLILIGLGYAALYYFLVPVRDPQVEPADARAARRRASRVRRSRPTRAPEDAAVSWSGRHPGAGLRAGVAPRRGRADRRGRARGAAAPRRPRAARRHGRAGVRRHPRARGRGRVVRRRRPRRRARPRSAPTSPTAPPR